METSSRRVVLDTNVVISRMLAKGMASDRAFDRLYRDGVLLASRETLGELRVAASRKKFERYASLLDRVAFVDLYATGVEIVQITALVADCRDPRDNIFLELALSGSADMIVTGDEDLLCLHPWRGIAILRPADYLERVNAG